MDDDDRQRNATAVRLDPPALLSSRVGPHRTHDVVPARHGLEGRTRRRQRSTEDVSAPELQHRAPRHGRRVERLVEKRHCLRRVPLLGEDGPFRSRSEIAANPFAGSGSSAVTPASEHSNTARQLLTECRSVGSPLRNAGEATTDRRRGKTEYEFRDPANARADALPSNSGVRIASRLVDRHLAIGHREERQVGRGRARRRDSDE